MPYELLLSRISECLKRHGLSEIAACERAGIGVNTIRHIRKRGHSPKIENLHKLAQALCVPTSYFLEAAAVGDASNIHEELTKIQTVFVKGAVQAGHWQEAAEWPAIDWYPVYAPSNARYPSAEKFGLIVKGNSMNKVFPDGSVVIAVKFSDIHDSPRPGQRVVVIRRSINGFEATVKKFDLDKFGRIILWPESSYPEYQQPFIIERKENSNDYDQSTCAPDISIEALVIGCYRNEDL